MRSTTKKLTLIALSFVLAFGLMPAAAFAEGEDEIQDIAAVEDASTDESFADEEFASISEEDAAQTLAVTSQKTLTYIQSTVANVGTQVSTGHTGCCLAFCEAYGDTMFYGKTIAHTQYAYYGDCYSNPCATWDGWGSSTTDLNRVYTEINAGRPVILHVKSSSIYEHWVLVIGYQNVTSATNITLSNLVAIDPWNGNIITVSDKYSRYSDGEIRLSTRGMTVVTHSHNYNLRTNISYAADESSNGYHKVTYTKACACGATSDTVTELESCSWNVLNGEITCSVCGSDLQPSVATRYGDSVYERYDANVSWQDAEAFCSLQGGHLVAISSEEEQAAVMNLAFGAGSTASSFWMGLSDEDGDGTWELPNCEESSYSNWAQGSPAQDSGIADYAVLQSDGTWTDSNAESDKTCGFICEYDNASDYVIGTGWFDIGEQRLYYENGTPVTGWRQISGVYYYFDADGFMQTGWVTYKERMFYLDPTTGAMTVGWKQWDDGTWSYFSTSGAARKGWTKDSKNWYYMSADDFKSVTGIYEIDGVWYAFGANYTMATSWVKWADGTWSLADASGVLQSGWVQDSKYKYYIPADGDGAFKTITGLQDIDGARYAFSNSGAMYTGFHKINGVWYYFASDGKMAYGWQKVSNKWYYLAKADGELSEGSVAGQMATGFYTDATGHTYYLGGPESGSMRTGWQKVGTKWFYFASSGVMQTGWKKISNKWYYLYKCDDSYAESRAPEDVQRGQMAASTTVKDSKGWCVIASNGVWNGTYA